jgi:hypothetical protein
VPAAVGVTDDDGMHVPGAPDVHVSATLPLYPFNAVSVPFHVTFWFTNVEGGIGVTAIAKSGGGPPPPPATPPHESKAINPSASEIPAIVR